MKSLQKDDPILENMVIELVKQSPKWTPGKYKNEVVSVSVTYQVPVMFQLHSLSITK